MKHGITDDMILMELIHEQDPLKQGLKHIIPSADEKSAHAFVSEPLKQESKLLSLMNFSCII